MTANVGKLEYTSAAIGIEDCVWDNEGAIVKPSQNNVTTDFGKCVSNNVGNKASKNYGYKSWGILLHDLIDQAVNTATIVKNQPVSILREGLCKIKLHSSFNAVQGNKASYKVDNDTWGNHQTSSDKYKTQSNITFQENAVAGSLVLVKIEKNDDPATYDITTYTDSHIGVVSSPASDRIIETYKNGNGSDLQFGDPVKIKSNGTHVENKHNWYNIQGIVIRDPSNPPTGAPTDTSNKIAVGADLFVLRTGEVYVRSIPSGDTSKSNGGNRGTVLGGPVGMSTSKSKRHGFTTYGHVSGNEYSGTNAHWLETTAIGAISRLRIDLDTYNFVGSDKEISERELP